MRERNKEIVKNVGELSKEIEEQDLEQVNGGDAQEQSVSAITAATIGVVSAMTIAKSQAAKKCSAVWSVSAECLDGKKC